jgi:hypothetical protein
MTKQIELQCFHCKLKFSRDLKNHKYTIKHYGENSLTFCSKKCSNDNKKEKLISLICDECSVSFSRISRQYKKDLSKSKTKNKFCSTSCSATF